MKPTGYISLPSNSKDGTDNTTTRYITNLDIPFKLEGGYEVAIVEAIYTQSWFLSVGYIEYAYADIVTNQSWQKIPIKFYDGENLVEFCLRINDQIKDFLIQKIYNSRYAFLQSLYKINNEASKAEIEKLNLNLYPTSYYDTINSYKNKFSVIEDIKRKENEYIEAFSLNIINSRIIIEFKSKKQSIKFFGDITKILKINQNEILESHTYAPLSSFKKSINDNELHEQFDPICLLGTLIIYSDIGEYTYYGSQMMPLLRTLVIDYKTIGRTLISHFDTPHYIKINKEEINSILIDIRDDFGEKIYFENSKITIKLHYRPISG
jgi:hypothetical protein